MEGGTLFSDRSLLTMLHGLVLSGGALMLLVLALTRSSRSRPMVTDRASVGNGSDYVNASGSSSTPTSRKGPVIALPANAPSMTSTAETLRRFHGGTERRR